MNYLLFIIIVFLILLVSFILNKNKETFYSNNNDNDIDIVGTFHPCKDLSTLKNIKYTALTEDKVRELRDKVGGVRLHKVSYSCPAATSPEAKVSAAGGVIEPPLIHASGYMFNPADIESIDPSLVKTINGTKVVSHHDMIPLLIGIIKEIKMGSSSSIEKADKLDKKATDMFVKLNEFENWKNDQML